MRIHYAIGLGLVFTQPVSAQEFVGSEFAFEYNQISGGTEVNGATFFAGMEIGVADQFSFGINLVSDDFVDEEESVTFHGSFRHNDMISYGGFYALSADDDRTAYGVEVSAFVLGGQLEMFIGDAVLDEEDYLLFGTETIGRLGNSPFYLFTEFDLIANDDLARSTNEMGVAYALESGPAAYLQIGRISETRGSDTVNRDYIGAGVQLRLDTVFGPTFSAR